MKISKKGRYALRLMIDLASKDNDEPIRIRDVAQRQGISDKYLEQIISVLNKAGYVKSIRGPRGGYIIKKKPEEYTVGMILRLTEGSIVPVDCVEDENGCERKRGCVAHILWTKINDAVNEVVDNVTLKDLVEWKHDM